MKAHLIESPEPVREFLSATTSVCGETIQHPVILFMWDDLVDGGEWLAQAEKLQNVCRACVTSKRASGGYVYGAREAERNSK